MLKDVDRAPRVPIKASLRYREWGETEWQAGSIVTVSRSGVVFRSTRSPEVKMPVDMVLTLPPDSAGQRARLYCSGHVVRHAHAMEPEPHLVVAATIATYRWVVKSTEHVSFLPDDVVARLVSGTTEGRGDGS